MAQPKGKKSNNQKKAGWHCFTSKDSMLRQIRGTGLLSLFDTYKPDKRIIEATEQDILEFVNRECRALSSTIL